MHARMVFVVLVVVAVRDAAIEAAQQAVALRTGLADALQHTVDRHADQHQRMRSEHQAGLQRLGHDLCGTGAGQALHVALVGRSHDNGQVVPHFLDVVQHLLGQGRIADRDDDHAGPHQAGRHQRLLAPGIAIDDVLTAGRGFAHPVGVEVEGNVVDVLLGQETRQVLAVTAEAAEDGVLFRTHRLDGDLGQLHRAHQPFAGHEADDDAFAVLDDERCNQHGQHQYGQGDLLNVAGQTHDFTQQHETEFAAGAEP